VNNELDITELNFSPDETDPAKMRFDSVQFNYNDTPVRPKKGILVGSDY